jgi:4-hydroxy-2-oxoheptanedioate aldolase
MRTNVVRAACYAGSVSIGSFVSLNDPVAMQIMAASGYAWLVIDMEHGPVALDSLPTLINAVRTTDVEPFVRAAWNTNAALEPVLDCGASGIMVPMVNNAADANRAVDAVRFAPAGSRSRGGVRGALAWNATPLEFFTQSNDEVLLMVQIETAESIENLDAIAAVEGVDCIFVGPNDLASAYGLTYPAAWNGRSGAYAAAVEAVPVVAKKHDKIPGILAGSPAMAKECIALGYTLVGCGTDTGMLWDAARKTRAEIG